VVHAHYGLTGVPALFRHNAPLVITLHGSDALVGWFEPLISRWACRRADATILVSRRMSHQIPGEVIPCGVDLGTFAPRDRAEARRRTGLTLENKYVLFPFDPQRKVKRFDLASAAVQRLAERGEHADLISVWKVNNREMPWLYSAVDAMILCSDSEGSPTSVKEALACNLPLVTTDVGDVREITDGIAGVEICARNPEALANGLTRAMQPKPGFVFNGRSAMARYSQDKMAAAILGVYRRAMEHAATRQRGPRSDGRRKQG